MAAVWTFADGTVVREGGVVEGSSAFAVRIRERMDEHRAGQQRLTVRDSPSGRGPVDLDDVRLLKLWLSDVARCRGVEILSAPDVPHVPADPNAAPYDPDGIY